MKQESCKILAHNVIQGSYWRLRLNAPAICAEAQPGQFVHVSIPGLEGHILRRPFSICDVNGDELTLVYKSVGTGTRGLNNVSVGSELDILGPLGHGFTPLPVDRTAYLGGGGYGCAAMLFVAHRAVAEGKPAPVILLGARTKDDILLVDEFTKLGCEVQITTDDGSMGTKGRITVVVEPLLNNHPDAWLATCGPKPMMAAISRLAEMFPQATCEVSLDEIMCCGVGACFGCVIKCKADTPSGWAYKRSCKEGPVFNAKDVWWKD